MKHEIESRGLRGHRQLVVGLALALLAGFLPFTMGLAFLGLTGVATWKATHVHGQP